MTTRRSPRRRWTSVRLTARDVAHDLEQRHRLRWHGLCIGTLTLLGMLLAAWLQKQAGVHLLSVRYAITLAVGYGIYLLVLRWWAARLLDDEEEHGSADAGDALDVAVEIAFSVATARAAVGVEREGWLSAAVRLTWKPLLGALVCAVLLGVTIDHFLPHVHSLPEALRVIQGR